MRHILAALFIGLGICAVPLFAQGFFDGASKPTKFVGKPCPELKFENYMIQGDSIVQADMHGRVVYINFYQT